MYLVFSEKDLERDSWSEFVKNHPQGNIFQTPEYFYSFYKQKDSDAAIVAIFSNETKEFLGLVVAIILQEGKGLKGVFSRRAIIMGSPLVKENNVELMDALLNAYNLKVKDKVIYSQFRNMFDMQSFSDAFHRNGYFYEDHLNIIIDITKSEEVLWNEVHSKRRNQIRKAIKENLEVKELKGKDNLKIAFEILKEVYSNANLPLLSFECFKKVYENLSEKGYIT
jgi:serine/alanine adding enzyme